MKVRILEYEVKKIMIDWIEKEVTRVSMEESRIKQKCAVSFMQNIYMAYAF